VCHSPRCIRRSGATWLQEFKDKAIGSRKDAAFTNILERLEKLQQTNPQRAFGIWLKR